MMSSSGSTALAAASAAASKAARPGVCRASASSACATATRLRLRAADRDARLAHHAVPHAIGGDRHGDRKIAGAAAELVEAAMGVLRQERQPHLRQQLVLLQRRAS